MANPEALTGSFAIHKDANGDLMLSFKGSWTIRSATGEEDEIFERLQKFFPVRSVTIDTEELAVWDSLFISVLVAVHDYLRNQNIEIRFSGLSEGASHMLKLATSTHSSVSGRASKKRRSFIERVGMAAQSVVESVEAFHEFLGEVVLGILSVALGRNKLRLRDFFNYLEEAGARALGIVSLVSFLVGLILAFVATVQLKVFGAQIFVANLVGISMARDMGAMMCGIIMAGRTGATYAAQLGTMQVNEEIDALRTLGINPVYFLVVPRILALSLMMPLLCVYADLMGIAGGAVVGAGFSDITLHQYINQTREAVPLTHFFIGIVKSYVYGLIVALVGCQKGLSCGRSAAAVGRVTTSAVVTAIVWIIIACAIITIICYVLNL